MSTRRPWTVRSFSVVNRFAEPVEVWPADLVGRYAGAKGANRGACAAALFQEQPTTVVQVDGPDGQRRLYRNDRDQVVTFEGDLAIVNR